MGYRFICSLQRVLPTSTFHFISSKPLYVRSTFDYNHFVILPSQLSCSFNQWKSSWDFRCYSHGLVNLVISQGKPKFETHETDPPKKEKWKTKKRLKMQRLREKKKRKSANKRDPRCLGVKGKKKKQKFPNAEERIKYKIKMAKVKEELLIERLKRYEISRAEGPVIKPENLTGEERFYMKKMAQKRSNYVPVGRRGIFGGVILNMHLHWKKHETVKVICKPCKPGQVHEYAKEISRLSGGIPIQIIGNDTIIFYRGKDYVQPEVMSPIDTLSKKKALEKSKYEQSLESVRRFIAIAEKELELYYRHVALYGDPEDKSHHSLSTEPINGFTKLGNSDTSAESSNSVSDDSSTDVSDLEDNATNHQLQSEVESDDDNMSGTETDLEYGSSDFSSEDDMATTSLHERSTLDRGSSIAGGRKQFEVQQFQVTGL